MGAFALPAALAASAVQTGANIVGGVAEANAAETQARADAANLGLAAADENLARREELRRVLAEQRVAGAVTGRNVAPLSSAARAQAQRQAQSARARFNLSSAILSANRDTARLNRTLGIVGNTAGGVSNLINIQRQHS